MKTNYRQYEDMGTRNKGISLLVGLGIGTIFLIGGTKYIIKKMGEKAKYIEQNYTQKYDNLEKRLEELTK